MKRTVRDLMTPEIVTLGRNETLRTADDVMRLGRIRHLPVVDDDGALAGIVSIGDVVKARVGQLELENNQLADYIGTR